MAFITLEQESQRTSKFNGKYAEKDLPVTGRRGIGERRRGLSLYIPKYVRSQSAITVTNLKTF